MTGGPLLLTFKKADRIAKEQLVFKETCPAFDRCTYCARIAMFHFDHWTHTCEKPACVSRAQVHVRAEIEERARKQEQIDEWREEQRRKKADWEGAL